jgi:hypothetical protein
VVKLFGADMLIAAGISDVVRLPIIAKEIAAALAYGLSLPQKWERRCTSCLV